jgi:hypothetical protein
LSKLTLIVYGLLVIILVSNNTVAGESELVIEVVSSDVPAAGETITILVTHEDEPLADALIVCDYFRVVGLTNHDGRLSFVCMPDINVLVIEAVKDGLQGKLTVDLE